MAASTEGFGRAALVHDWLSGMRGGENVLAEIAALFPGSPIYTLLHLEGSVSEEIERHPIHTSFLQRAPGLARHYRRYLPLFPSAIEDFDLAGYDLVISSSHCVAKGVIPPPGSFHVCYCHTPMRYAWDQEHAYFPKRRGLFARLRGATLSRLRQWDVAASQRVDLFLANSSFVASRIQRYYRREAEVLHPPVDTGFFNPGDAPAPDDAGRYCLMVSALNPYKRIELAISACRELGLGLHVVGYGPERARLRRLAGDGVQFHERIPPERLRELYRGALCFLQPGVEDFGISSVEALACGVPVVARGRGGVLDIVRDGEHGVLFDPASESADATPLVGAIDKCAAIGFKSLDLRERAESFSRARFRQRLQETLAEHRLPEGSDS